MKPRTPILQSTPLMDQVRERIRYLHYSLSTEKLYVYWVRFFIRWHGLLHPRDTLVSSPHGIGNGKPQSAQENCAMIYA